MVTAITTADPHLKGLGIAYATPTQVLREVLPEVVEHQVCPYRGLEPFTADHVGWFHGRDTAVEEVLTALRQQQRVLLLLGPSGAGKSSLIQAGLLPALLDGRLPGSDQWLSLVARPGHDLLDELEQAGLPGATTEGIKSAVERRLAAEPVGRRLVVVIDQFEELLSHPDTTSSDPHPHTGPQAPERRLPTVEQQLVALIDCQTAVSVILVMRDDFYPRLAAWAPNLLKAVTPGLLNVPATLNVPDLYSIITGPAAAVGAHWEEGLPDRIITDVLAADPTAPATRQAPVTLLPPLQLTLSQLWERRRDGRLTHHAYGLIGGVTGSLTTWCNTALGQLPAEHRPIARRILTALVRPADGTHAIPATRRHVPLTDLRALATDPLTSGRQTDEAFDTVLATLSRHRIITTRTTLGPDGTPGHATAELIHDALIRDWSDLRDWVAADHHFHAWLHRVGEQHARFAETGHPGDLLDGTDLLEGIAWSAQRGLPPDIATFLASSRQRQQAAVRRTRRINTALACMLALALVAASLAFWQRQTAIGAQNKAITAQRVAQSRQLATQSDALRDSDPHLASLLAVQAYRTSPTREATANLYKIAALPFQNTLTGHSGEVNSVSFSPDGRALATGSTDKTARLWDTATGEVRFTLRGHTDRVDSVAFSPDGRTLATGSADESVRLWDTVTGEVRSTLTGHTDGLVSAVFSPDGRTLATISYSSVRLWDTATGEARATLTGHDGIMTSAAFSPDGRTLATGSYDKTVRLWNVATGEVRDTLTGHTDQVGPVAFSPDGRTLVSSNYASVLLWDLTTGKYRRTLTGHTAFVSSVAFSPDGRSLATSSRDDTVRVWDVATGEIRDTITGYRSIDSVAFSPDGRTLATDGDRTVRLWDVANGEIRDSLRTGHTEGVTSVVFSPDGHSLATGSYDGTVRLWDTATGRARATLTGQASGIDAVAFSPDGRTVATGSSDASVRLLDIATGKTRATLTGHTEGVRSMAFSPDGRTLATGSDDQTVRLWDLATGKTRATLTGHTAGSTPLVYSPDGRTLATITSLGKAVRLWDAATGEARDTLTGHTEGVNVVAFSPDGRTLATGSDDQTVRLWNAATSEARDTLVGHTAGVTSVVFSPDGRTVATGSGDTVRLWDVATGETRDVLLGPAGEVHSVAFSPDGGTVATNSGEETVWLWEVNLPDAAEVINRICRGPGRALTSGERSKYLLGQTSGQVCP
jgi:WD40 repeat protein